MKSNFQAENAEEDIRKFLLEELTRRQKRNVRYSLRAFARLLGVNHSLLSEVLSGKRRLTQKKFEQIMKALQITDHAIKKFQPSTRKKQQQYTQLKDEALEATAQWYFPVLLEVLCLKPSFELSELHALIQLPEELILSALNILKSQNLVTHTRKNLWKVKVLNTTTWGNASPASIRSNNYVQRQFLEKQKQALAELSVEKRMSLGYTVAMNPDDLPEARKILLRFVHELSSFLERKGSLKKQVFHLNVGLFPITELLS